MTTHALLSSRSARLLGLGFALSLLTACGGEQGGQGGGGRPPTSVAVTTVERMDLDDTVRGIGTLHAKDQVEIKPEVSGRLEKVLFTEGSRVKTGQLLARLDARKLNASLDARRAELAEAEVRVGNALRRLERFEKVSDPAAVSKDDLDAVRTEVESARAELNRVRAELARAEEQLADTRITAPFSGLIGESLVDPGDYVEEGDKIATLHRVDTLEIVFTLPERHRARAALGQDVRAFVDAHGDAEPFAGRVTYVDPAVDPQTRTFTVKADIPNEEGLLTAGSFARAELALAHLEGRLVVPESALVATRNGYMVFVVEENTARQRRVTTGLRKPGRVEILEGVSEGESVVMTGHMNLFEGAPVAIAGEEAQGSAS